MRLDPANGEAHLRVVLAGGAFAGKTTMLDHLRTREQLGSWSGVTVADLHSERTLRLDLRTELEGRPARVQVVTVPGQSYYAATRKTVLAGADAVVFVVDSRHEAQGADLDAWNELHEHLGQLGQAGLPIVVFYNKRDLPLSVPREALDRLYNPGQGPAVEGSALRGLGVVEALSLALGLASARGADLGPPGNGLITCCRCQNLLEVPRVATGALFTCGACKVRLEVVDASGTTRLAPIPGARSQVDEGYASTELPFPDQPALDSAPGTASHRRVDLHSPRPGSPGLILPPGLEVLNVLEDSPLGLRLRVRETASGRLLRALAIAAPCLSAPGFAGDLERRARSAGALNHPNLLGLVRFHPGQGCLLSVDAPDHEPLSRLLSRRRVLAPPHAMGLLRQVALGLEEAGRNGLTHGWLRPECVLVDASGGILLDDLTPPKPGAWLAERLAGPMDGVEHYLAPRHAEGQRPDQAEDIFLLGALLFRMLSGQGLLTGRGPLDAIRRLRQGGVPSLRSAQPGTSRELDGFFQRLCALDPADRFPGWAAVINAIDAFGGGAERQAPRFTVTHRRGGTGTIRRGTGALPGTGTASFRRGGTGTLPRPGTGALPRPSTASYRRGTGPLPGPATGSHVRQPSPSPRSGGETAGLILAIVAVGALVAVLAMLAGRQPSWQKQPPDDPPPMAEIPDPPRTTGSATEQAGLAERCDRLIAGQLLGDAAQLLPRLSDADRLPRQERIQAEHRRLRNLVTDQVASARDENAARLLLQPVGRWRMAGDQVWADELLARARQRWAMASARPAPAPEPADPTPPEQVPANRPTGEPSPAAAVAPLPGDPWRAFDRAAQLQDRAQLAGTPISVVALPEAAWTRALATKAALIDRRHELIASARDGKTVLRCAHPVTGELCDLTRADSRNVDFTAVDGSSSTLPWPLLPPRQQGELAAASLRTTGLTPDRLAIACAWLSACNDLPHAILALRQARPGLDPGQAEDLDLCLGVTRRLGLAGRFSAAEAAFQAGSPGPIRDLLTELRKPDAASLPGLAGSIAQAEAMLARLAATEAATPALKDRIGFETVADLRLFPTSSANWSVAQGLASNAGSPARLGRQDARDLKAVVVTFRPELAKGTFTIDFRGVLAVFDLAGGRFHLQQGGRGSRPRPVTLPTGAVSSVTLEWRAADRRIRAQVNSGVLEEELAVAEPGDALLLLVEAGAQVGIDTIQMQRETGAAAGRNRLVQLGWEPSGEARLEGQRIILPALAGGRSGISTRIKGSHTGYAFEVRGEGDLQLRFAREIKGGREWDDFVLQLPSDRPLRLVTSWNGGSYLVSEEGGAELLRRPCPSPPVEFGISAGRSAELAGTPQPVLR